MTIEEQIEGTIRRVVREEFERFAQEHRAMPSPERKELEVLDVAGVVALLPNTTPEAVCSWCRSGRLAAKKVGRGWMIKRSALDRFLSSISGGSGGAPEPEREATRILSNIRGG